jgi:N-acetyl-gamma-glutamyl-phosphate reductase
MVKVAILGGSGYTALELMKILLRHPHAKIEAVCSRQAETPLVSEMHPVLLSRLNLRSELFDPNILKDRGVQCVFGCLPHGASATAIKQLLPLGLRVIDLSADYRLRDAVTWAEWYGETHHDPDNLAAAVYGLPEFYADAIRKTQLLANPGCYPQTAILGLLPLVKAHAIELQGIIVDSKSGVSGAGRTPKLTTHFPECNESFSAYSVGRHRHQPEMEQVLSDAAGQKVEILFTPHLVPMDRGIFSTIYATPTRTFTEIELKALYREFYAAAPFIRIRDNPPASKDTAYTNFVDLAFKVVRGKIIILATEDNLVRGASGVAVQNFNLMYGFDQTTGLL